MAKNTMIVTVRGMPKRLWLETKIVAMRHDVTLQQFVIDSVREHVLKHSLSGKKVRKSIYETAPK